MVSGVEARGGTGATDWAHPAPWLRPCRSVLRRHVIAHVMAPGLRRCNGRGAAANERVEDYVIGVCVQRNAPARQLLRERSGAPNPYGRTPPETSRHSLCTLGTHPSPKLPACLRWTLQTCRWMRRKHCGRRSRGVWAMREYISKIVLFNVLLLESPQLRS